MRCAVMLCLVAFTACRSSAPESRPTHAETPPPITATPADRASQSPTPPPTTGTRTPPAMAPPLVTPPPPLPNAPPAPAPGAAAETTTCQKDADCALTYVPEAGCCPTMCAPRGVTVAEARRREGLVQQCEQSRGHPCPVPACRARAFEVACTAGVCTARPANTD